MRVEVGSIYDAGRHFAFGDVFGRGDGSGVLGTIVEVSGTRDLSRSGSEGRFPDFVERK